MGPLVPPTYIGPGHWRALADGTDDGFRVLMRQVAVGEERHVEIAENGGWRRMRAGERFLPRKPALPQVDDGWVR